MADNKKTLGQSLKMKRELKGYSLRQVEALTKISNAYLSQLENDKIKSPSVSTLYELAECYGVDFNEILELAGAFKSKPQQTRSRSSFALSSEDLTPQEEEELMRYLKFIRSQNK